MVVQERPGTAYQGCGHFLLPIFDVYERELVLTTRHFACLLSITAPSCDLLLAEHGTEPASVI